MLNPNPGEALPGVAPVTSLQDTTARSDSFYITDTIGFDQYFDLLASARYDRFSADYAQRTVLSGAVLNLNHVDNVGSPRAAFEYKPHRRSDVLHRLRHLIRSFRRSAHADDQNGQSWARKGHELRDWRQGVAPGWRTAGVRRGISHRG